jgi:hypothetical protein
MKAKLDIVTIEPKKLIFSTNISFLPSRIIKYLNAIALPERCAIENPR